MKRLKAVLAATAAVAATIAGLDVTGFVTVLPYEVARWLVILPSAGAAVVHVVTAVQAQLNKMKP